MARIMGILFTAFVSSAAPVSVVQNTERLEKQLSHALAVLPFVGVFDNLEFNLDGSHANLFGQVSRPSLKVSAERAAAGIEGIESITNGIEVLPLSIFDSDIRQSVYRAVYGSDWLSKYAISADPSIHIIVKNSRVSLEGVVANEADRNLAFILTCGVPGVFKVTNNLRVGDDGR